MTVTGWPSEDNPWVLTRAIWGADDQWLGPAQTLPVPGVRLHHTVNVVQDLGPPGFDLDDWIRFMRRIEAEAPRPDLGDRFPYPWIVLADWVVGEGQGWDHRGAHTAGHNGDTAVAYPGNRSIDPLTVAEVDTTRWLIAEGVRLGKIEPDPPIDPHSETAATECPGNFTRAALPAIRVPWTPTPSEDEMPDPIIGEPPKRYAWPDLPAGTVIAKSAVAAENVVSVFEHARGAPAGRTLVDKKKLTNFAKLEVAHAAGTVIVEATQPVIAGPQVKGA